MRCQVPAGVILAMFAFLSHGLPLKAQPASSERTSPGVAPNPSSTRSKPATPHGAPPRAKTTAEKSAKGEAMRLSRQAIKSWNSYEYIKALTQLNRAYKLYPDHNLLFNIGLVNQSLGRYVIAIAAFERFLKRAKGPAYVIAVQKAKERIQSLSTKVATVHVRVKQRGTVVTLDRQDLGRGPLSIRKRVMPGLHLLVVSRRGYMTRRVRFGVSAGRTRVVTTHLARLPPKIIRTKLGRRFPRWLPWAVLGVGALVAAIGAPVMWKANEDYKTLDGQIQELSDTNGGQPVALTAKMKDLRSRAQAAYGFSVAFYTLGALSVAGGIAMAILNRPRAISPETSQADDSGERRVKVTPFFSPQGGGATVTLTW